MTDSHEIAVSGRIRLARNYHDLPFCDQKNASTCLQRAYEAMHTKTDQLYTLHVLNSMQKDERLSLMEEHLISADLLKNAMTGAALIRTDRKVSIMINEEDHLRIQAIEAGSNLDKAAEEAFEAEEILEKICRFSFDPQFGYLTSCPTNTGTGMRASLMLHLPMLTRFKQMGNVGQNIAKLGLTIRGIYGEGSEALGDLYQVSNQVSLGRSETDIIQAVTAIGKQLIDMESGLRERCMKRQQTELKDTIMRSYGLMKYAITMDEKEFMQHWSNLRLGISLSLIPVALTLSDELLTTAQNAHVNKFAAGRQIPSPKEARCEWIRECLNRA
ncbi:MAG: ATP--guanido phosphotransferase [Clostridiales bacterium]|nr:ATP--guanido phosphotransferase [Clostridiales bacterium]